MSPAKAAKTAKTFTAAAKFVTTEAGRELWVRYGRGPWQLLQRIKNGAV